MLNDLTLRYISLFQQSISMLIQMAEVIDTEVIDIDTEAMQNHYLFHDFAPNAKYV
jgi:hypothetical protein